MTTAAVDLAAIEARLTDLGWTSETPLERMASPTQGGRHQICIVRYAGEILVVRVPITSALAADSHVREMHNMHCAAASGVAVAPVLADPLDGLLVLPFVAGKHPEQGAVDMQSAVRIGH